MPGNDFEPLPTEPLQQLREAADAILDLRDNFLELLMVSDAEFERTVSVETQRCLTRAMR
jgi:hypothetical protein